MVLETYDVSNIPLIEARPLTPENFKPYGGVISADHQIQSVDSSAANYGTAKKIHKVCPIVNNYKDCKSGKPATANWNIFRCTAPKHLITDKMDGSKMYKSKVLERHPYTTQTFIPMGQDLSKKSYIVIVAKTNKKTGLPNPAQVKAFICNGNQSITYGAGTWHAPMVVIDEDVPHIDFAVMIHENGVEDEDTQECYFKPGYDIKYSLSRDKKL